MRNKYKNGEKGLWIIIQRYPESFFICPGCGDLSYNRLDNKSIKECTHNEKINSFEFNLKYDFLFRCKSCNYIITGRKVYDQWWLSIEFIKDFFTDDCTTPEERTFENFKILIKEWLKHLHEIYNIEVMTYDDAMQWKNREGKYSHE